MVMRSREKLKALYLKPITTKPGRVVTYDKRNSSVTSDDPLITRGHVTNSKFDISSYARSLTTRHHRLLTDG